MRTKWDQMTAGEKIILAMRIALSVIVVVFALLQVSGVWDQAVDYAVPLLGIYLLALSVQEWKEKRGSVILSICLALFIFACTAAVWLGR